MRRADRLFLLIQALRGRRTPVTAGELARSLEVSARTIYRDVADLQRSGVPIEGEAGVGYVLRRGADIPPLMFDPEELEALVVGTRFVGAFAGERLTAAARRALIKIEAVLPAERRQQSERSRVYAPSSRRRARDGARMDRLHAAIAERNLVRFAYVREDGAASRREVEPICLAFWGHAWTLGAYCRLRRSFRNFRLDRIEELEISDERFAEDPERGLSAYLRSMEVDPEAADRIG
ncbi:MAG: YafY family transcriptional regulator [Myxococcales bacterium]|nr:YafY family transcriptional regulator [Myxococcales bacterium]